MPISIQEAVKIAQRAIKDYKDVRIFHECYFKKGVGWCFGLAKKDNPDKELTICGGSPPLVTVDGELRKFVSSAPPFEGDEWWRDPPDPVIIDISEYL